MFDSVLEAEEWLYKLRAGELIVCPETWKVLGEKTEEYRTPPLREIMERYRDEITPLRCKNPKHQNDMIDRMIRDYPGFVSEPIGQIDAEFIQTEWVNKRLVARKLSKTGRDLGQISSDTVRREYGCLSGIFTQARKWKHIKSRDFMEDVELPPKGEGRRRGVTPEELQAMFQYLHFDPERPEISQSRQKIGACARVAMGSAMRLKECVLMQWGWLSADCAIVELPVGFAKTSKSRLVPLSSGAAEMLRKIRPEHVNYADRVFPGLSPDTASSTWRDGRDHVCGHLPLEKRFRFHDLRGTSATGMLRHMDSANVMHITGHTDPKMLAAHYNGVDVEYLRKGLDKMESDYFGGE